MRERVEAHGGELKIDFDPAGGLSLHAWIPVAPQGVEAVDA
jgi:signal transduction histidine kinase